MAIRRKTQQRTDVTSAEFRARFAAAADPSARPPRPIPIYAALEQSLYAMTRPQAVRAFAPIELDKNGNDPRTYADIPDFIFDSDRKKQQEQAA